MSNHMFLQACLIVSGGVIVGSAAKEKTIFTTIARSYQNSRRDWKQLFNGKSLDGWHTYQQQKADSWTVVDGMLYCRGNQPGVTAHADLVTDTEYDNFELSLDWKIAKAANSGILYLVSEAYKGAYQSGPEYQLIDDTGYPGKLENWQKTGANYAMNAPLRDATKPAGEWNHTRIIVNNAHVEHWLNDQKVVEYELWTEEWKAHKAAGKWKDEPGYGAARSGRIALQDHGGEAWFRNIRIRKL